MTLLNHLILICLMATVSANTFSSIIDSNNGYDYHLTLQGKERAKNGSGYRAGLMFWNPTDWRDPVWHWDNVNMTVDGATGDAYVWGDMTQTRSDNNGRFIPNGDVWSFDLTLTGLTRMDSDFSGTFDDDAFTEFFSGTNASSESRWDLDMGWNAGLLNVYDQNGDFWNSLSGKKNHNDVVADLYYNTQKNALIFGAWYENDDFMGDSQAKAKYQDKVYVPEPRSVALLGLGFLCLVIGRKKNLA